MRPQRKVNIWIKNIPSHDYLPNSLNLLTYSQEKEEACKNDLSQTSSRILYYCSPISGVLPAFSRIYEQKQHVTWCEKFEEAARTSPGPLPSPTGTGLGSKAPMVQNLGSTHSQSRINGGLALAWPREWVPKVPCWPHPGATTARQWLSHQPGSSREDVINMKPPSHTHGHVLRTISCG